MEPAPEHSAVVTRVSDELEAEIACGLLRTAGISCGFRDTPEIETPLEDFIQAGPQEILVRPEDVETAREILARRD